MSNKRMFLRGVVMTNYENIKSMSFEEMLNFLQECNCSHCIYDVANCAYWDDEIKDIISPNNCNTGMKTWLEQEV